MMFSFAGRAQAASTDYTLDGSDRIPIPRTYIVKNVIYNTGNLGDETGYLNNADDIFINKQGFLYVADTGNNRVLRLSTEGRLTGVFKEADGIPFKKPKGIFVDDDGNMYVADTGNGRIVHLSAEGEFVETFFKPESELINQDFFEYAPSKISISLTGYIYILKDESIFMMDADNGFRGYLGQSKIGFSFIDVILRKVASEAQKLKIVKRNAAPFLNMHVDENGIIYAATLDSPDDTRNKLIKKLNAVGENIYTEEKDFGEGADDSGRGIVPRFVDIVADSTGIITVVEDFTGKIYQYDQDGNLLTAFGGKGDQKGKFVAPCAIAMDKEGNIYVLDKISNTIQVFAPTEFISLVHDALNLYHNGEYEKTKDVWEKVLKIDENYELAHLGVAKTLFKQKQWKAAMDEFRQANNKEGYSKAFEKYRHEIFRKYFVFVVLAVILAVYLLLRLIILMKKSGENTLDDIRRRGFEKNDFSSYFRLSLSVLFHPIETFETLKINRAKINIANSIIMLVIAFAVRVFYIYVVHFPLADIEPRDSNIWLEALRIILPVLSWVVGSFAITSILDGESTIKEILNASSLCMVPYIIISIPLAILSRIMCGSEQTLYSVISIGTLVWVIMLFCISIKTMNDYKIFKSILASLMSIAGMLLIWAVTLILFVFTIQLYEFFAGLMVEIRMLLL